MAISPAISVSQSTDAPQYVTVEDESTGTYDTITQRRLFIQDAFGEYLTGDGSVDYDEWALADDSITVDVLTGDTAANVKVEWLNSSNVVVSQINANYPFPKFGKKFFVYLIQQQGLTPGVYQDTNYSGNIALFWSNLVGGVNQVEDGNDIAGAQNCFNRTNEMRLNESYYF